MASTLNIRLQTRLRLCTFITRRLGMRTSLVLKRHPSSDHLLGLQIAYRKAFFICHFQVALSKTDTELWNPCKTKEALPLDNGSTVSYAHGSRPRALSNLQNCDRQRAVGLRPNSFPASFISRVYHAPFD